MTAPIDINKGKAIRAKTKPVADKIGKNDIFRQIVMKMNGDPFAPPDWPEFSEKFHVVVDHAGRKAVLEEDQSGIVSYRDRDVVASAILNYCWDKIAFIPGARIDAETAGKVRNMWIGLTKPLPDRPALFLEKSTPGLTFKRLDFDAPPAESFDPPPAFERLLDRTSDPHAICAYVGSLFYPEADRQQYLYMYGEGGDGKGALMRFLHGIFGEAAASLTPPPKFGDKFWNFNVYGKRLGLFYDCEDWNWFKSSHFKSLTGGDPILFEEKGRMGFTDTPSLKFIAASNAKPNISSQASDLRRLIFVAFEPLPEGERHVGFEALLLAEAQPFISMCKAIYLARCPGHEAIDVPQAIEVAWNAESEYVDLFNAHFVDSKECEIPADQVRRILREDGVKNTAEIQRIKDVWARLFGVTVVRRKKGFVYQGMGLRSFMEEGQRCISV